GVAAEPARRRVRPALPVVELMAPPATARTLHREHPRLDGTSAHRADGGALALCGREGDHEGHRLSGVEQPDAAEQDLVLVLKQTRPAEDRLAVDPNAQAGPNEQSRPLTGGDDARWSRNEIADVEHLSADERASLPLSGSVLKPDAAHVLFSSVLFKYERGR